MHMNKKYIGLAFSFLLIASCSLSTKQDATMEREVERTVSLREKAKSPTEVAVEDTVRVKNDIWLGDVSVVEYEGEPIPSHLEGIDAVTLISNRPVTLFDIGDMIAKVTSLSVRFSSEIEEKTLSDALKNKPDVKDIGADWTSPEKMLLSYKGSLSGLLDEVCSRFGLWWKYEDKTVYFYRQITKTFVIYSLPSKTSLSATVGGSSSGDGGSSAISLSNTAELELWANIESAIKSMSGSGSSVTTDPSNGTITVTARPTEISKIAKFVNEQNIRLSRQVAVSVKVLQVTVSDSDNYGLDISAAFDGGTSTVRSLGVSGAASTAVTGAGSMAMSIVSGDWSFDGVMSALSEQGTTSLVTSGTVTSLNNKPAPIQVVRKQTYISEITKTESGGSSETYDISTETEEIETGFTLDVLPRILEHNRMLLLFNLTLSDLLLLEKVPLEGSDADGGSYIQNPIIESRGFSQEVALRSGQSLVLTGFEKVTTTTQKTGVGSAENSLLGGTVAAEKERSILVIILTPVVLDSPLNPESRMNKNK